VYDVWRDFAASDGKRVICSQGPMEEREAAIGSLTKGKRPRLVADLTAVLTLFAFPDAVGKVIEHFGKPIIAQASIDEILDMIHRRQCQAGKAYMLVVKEGDRFVRREVTKDDISREQETLENLLNWVRVNFEVMSTKKLLAMGRMTFEHMCNALGNSFAHSCVLASEPNRILFSDDLVVRLVAKNELEVDGVWSQAVILALARQRVMSAEQYDNFVLGIASLNYHYCSISAQTLSLAARQGDWRASKGFCRVAAILGDSTELESLAVVVTTFVLAILHMLQHEIDYLQAESLIFAVLDVMKGRRDGDETIRAFCRGFRHAPLQGECARMTFDFLFGRWTASRRSLEETVRLHCVESGE
jgi:hypothetical protein